MKRFLGLSAVFLGMTGIQVSAAFAQSGWFLQNPRPPGVFSRVVAVDAQTAFLLGDGTILRTDNGGETWTTQEIGTTVGVLAASFLEGAKVGVAVGGYGFILRTTDGGALWTIQASASSNLYAVTSADPNTWVAVGGGSLEGLIARSTDGGTTWTRRYIGPQALYGVAFTDPTTGIAAGLNGILRTTDSGETWTAQDLETPGSFYSLALADSNVAVAVGYQGMIQRSTDGGITWMVRDSGTRTALTGVSFG